MVLQVHIEILDRNDSPPKFPKKESTIQVSENAAVGQVITTLQAIDADSNGSISYSLLDGDDGKFHVEPTTGQVRILESLDREETEKYVLKIRASDGAQYSEATLIVEVQIANIFASYLILIIDIIS